jgi:hypothetical protein
MMVAIEVLALVGAIIVPVLISPKKKTKLNIDTNTHGAEYAVDEDGCLVRLQHNKVQL